MIAPMLEPSSRPALSDSTRRAFAAAGVGAVLDRAVSTLRETVAVADTDQTLLSSTPVVDVLTELPYDTEDAVYVVWRADRNSDFWTQARKERYLAHLRSCAAISGGVINQTRMMIYDDNASATIASPNNILPPDHILFSLAPLHENGSFLSLPSTVLQDYPEVAQLRFGYTVSSKHGYAIIPVPFAEDLAPESVAPGNIGNYLGGHRDYDEAEGPMRAVVTVNRDFVNKLLAATKRLATDSRARTL
jgi:hypothetical protein